MNDEAAEIRAIRGLEKSWCTAWNSHDMRALANLLSEDSDFVTVGGDWLRGRQGFREWHAALHDSVFKHSSFTVADTTVKFIGKGMALAHVKWKIEGELDPDGTPAKPRTGIFTQVLRKSRGKWLILASQNTNDDPLDAESFFALLKRRNWD